MELPWPCKHCKYEMMVEAEKLAKKQLDSIMSSKGFLCEVCNTWTTVSYTTVSLEEQMRKLSHYPPEHSKFSFLFKKTLRKAEGINLRGRAMYG